jgi:hypothetical protein
MNIRKYIAILMSWIFIGHRYRTPGETDDVYLAKAQKAVKQFTLVFFLIILTPFVANIVGVSLGKNLKTYVLLALNYLILSYLLNKLIHQVFTLNEIVPYVENNTLNEKVIEQRLIVFICVTYFIIICSFFVVMRLTEI